MIYLIGLLENPWKAPEQHALTACLVNKPLLASITHRLDEASVPSETLVPRL